MLLVSEEKLLNLLEELYTRGYYDYHMGRGWDKDVQVKKIIEECKKEEIKS